MAEDSLWNPNVGTPQEGINEYDQSLNSNFDKPDVNDGLNPPNQNVAQSAQPEPSQEDSGMWGYTEQARLEENQMSPNPIPDIPEAGRPGIDYDMGVVEKVGKSLMVGFGDMFQSVGDMVDFFDGSPSSAIELQVFGTQSDKPISDSLHNFAEYLQSYGDDVPGLTDLQDVTFESLLEPDFWMTSVARSLPFALSLMIPAGAAARGVGLLTKGAKFEAAAAAIAAGGRSIGLSANVSTALAATNLIKTGAATVAAGATSNFLEGAALAGQAMNEAIAQGVPVEDARLVGEQVMKDNLLSMGADIAQYALFMGAGGVGWAAKKGLQGLSGTVVGKTATAASKKAAIAALKNPGMTSVIKRASKILGAGAANGLTDGMIEQFQEVYQDWSVQRRIADAKGEDFPDYLEFFQDKEQLPTRVVSFATSLLMSGASNMIRTASENRVFLDKSLDDRLESHELLDIFNNEVEAGEYVTNKPTYTVDPTTGEPVEKDNITVLKAEQMQELGRDTAARTMIMNAVRGGVAETARVMEFLGAQLQAGTISESQMEMYQSTLTEVQDAVAKYPTQNLNNKQKTKLVAHAWLNNTVTQAIAKQIEDFDAQINEIQSLVNDGTQKQPWADGEIAGINVAKEQALKELKSIKSSSSETIRQIYKEAEQQTAKDVFQKNVAPLLDSAAQKASKGESLTSEEQEAVDNNKAAYKSYTESYTKVDAINKASEKLGKNISDYESTVNEDGGVEFKKSENGNTNVVTVDKEGNVTEKNSRTSDIVDEAVENLEQEAEQNQDSETTEDDGGIDEAINNEESVEAETINTEINSKNSTAGAIKLALENNLDISSLIGKGSGKNKRILKADVQRLLDVVNNTPEGQDDGQGRLFNSLLEGAKLINKQVAKSAKKVFSKETYGSVVSYVKKHMAKRRIKNAFIIGQGSERVLQSLFADKAADGLISSAIMTDIAKKGTNFLGYMAGLSVFIDADSEYADETFFHENFHGFRKLYGHLPEVQAMMKAIVDQEIYNSIKMTYARNIVYSHKRIAGSGTILQKQALKVINRNRGANNKIATTINEYSQMKGESITFELHKEFYESSLEILKKEGYVELESTNQTNIQDEALTKLAGIYGAENQDMFIADPAKRKAYNESMKSWKSKIASAFTKEEAEFSLEKASKGQYKKGNGLDLEESFAQIKDLIATKEKRYSNLKESPSTLDIQALERDAVRKEIRTVLVGERENIIKAAQDFKSKDLPKILEESSTGETDVDAQLEDIKSKIATSSAFRKLRVGLVQKILSPYKPGTEDFNTVREMLLTDEKYLSNIMNSFFQSKLQEDAINELNQQMIMFDNNTMEALRDDIDDESGAMLAQILDEHEHMSDKFYKIVRMFIEKEKYIGSNSISGRELKMVTNKENIMRGLKKLSLEYPSAEMFVTEAQELIEKRNFNPDVLEKVTGNFLHFLSTEIDSVGQDIFSAVLLQFRSMTTEKGLMIKDGTWALAMTTQMRRDINKAHNKVRENWEQSLTYRNEETRGEWLKSLAETRISSYNAIKFNSAQTRQDKDKYYKRINLRNTQEHYDIYRNYEARLDISRGLAKLLYETNGFNDKNVLDFINRNMLPSNTQLTSKQFKEQSIKDENGNIYSIQNYFTKERIEEMFWKTIAVDSTLQEQYNEEIGLKRFQEIAERDVLNQILGNSFYDVEMSRHLKSLKVNISDEKKQEIRNTYQQKIADRFQESKWTNALQEQNEAYIVQAGSLFMYDFSVKEGKDIDGLTFESGKVDEDNPNSTSRTFFIKSGTDVNEVQIKKDGTYKVVKSYHKKDYGSVSLFVVSVQDNPDVRAVFQDLKGLSYSSKQIIGAILDDTNEGYMSNQISPESNQINKVLRKYFLEYHKDSLSDFIKEDKSAFLSMFTYGKKAIHVNPYAMGMAQEDVLSPSYYELNYRTNDGDLDNVVDRNRMTNTAVTTADFNQILLAIENGNDTYHQVIKDYSDKSRRYYAKANTIKTREEAFRKLKDLVDYHKAKTQSIVDKHNDTNNDFDIHLVVGADIIAKLEESGYLIDQLEVDNRGALKGTRGQLNLLDDEIFKLTIDGENYDLSNIKEHSRMMSVLSGRVDLGGDVSTQLLASVNYFVNKYWLQDLNASTMEEQSFVMKNKRATGWIANHDSTFAGERVELIVFKDVEVTNEDLVHKVQVLGPDGLESVDIAAETMDSASYVTEETANKIINKHGNIVDVKGSFKFVGYGRNIDNKKIASFFGQESNQFYAKGHTIVLNEKTQGPLKSIYKALKAREKYNKDNGLHLNNVMAYANDAMKKGLVYGKGDKQKNHLGLNEWSSLLKEGDEAVNNFINSYSYDEMSDNYGYDGRFFGIQGELDKDSKTATASKQMFSNIQLFLDHPNSEVRKAAQAIAISHISALEEQTNSSEVMTKSREDLLLGKIEDESFATTLKTLLEDGYTDMPAMRDALLKLLQAKIVKGATKLRTGGTLSLQESDVLYGWKAGEVKDVVQTDLALKPMSVIANTNSPKYKGKKKAEGYKVQVAEAAISSHMAEQLGLTSDDYDSKTGKIKDEKQIEFLATRIPAGSSGSTVVLKSVYVALKPGNTIAIHPTVSAILGSDLDGDMLHINTINTSENLSPLQEKTNTLTQSIMDMFKMPEIQNSLTKEVEFKSVMKATDSVLESGASDIANDFSLLGAHQMYGQTKGNAPMIALIASQNLVYNYISKGNPSIMFGGKELSFKDSQGIIIPSSKELKTLDNNFTEDGGGTWYEITKWLNLVLDDGKNNKRAKYGFMKNTGSAFVMLLKMGVRPEKIASFMKSTQWNSNPLYMFYDEQENRLELESKLKEALLKRLPKKEASQLKNASHEKLIDAVYSKDGKLSFDLSNTNEIDQLALFLTFQKVNDDIFSISHFLSLDKAFSAEPIIAMSRHHKGLSALANQTSKDLSVDTIGSKMGNEGSFFRRSVKLHSKLLNKLFTEDPEYSNGYTYGLLGAMQIDGLKDKSGVHSSSGVLNSEINTYSKTAKNNKGAEKHIGILTDGKKYELSEYEEANIRLAKALTLTRAAIHSNIDLKASIIDNVVNPKNTRIIEQHPYFNYLTKAEQYAIVTQKISEILDDPMFADNRFGEYVDDNVSYRFTYGHEIQKIRQENKVDKPAEPSSVTPQFKTEKIHPGVEVKRNSITEEEQKELFEMLSPYIIEQGAKTNKSKSAPVMIGLGLRWDYKSNNPNLNPINVGDILGGLGQKEKYGYYDKAIDGSDLPPINNRLKELMTKATGIDASNYDGAIVNVYRDDSFISTHQDVDESAGAKKYPVLVTNLGGSGNLSLERVGVQQVSLDSGDSYVFGIDGVNRDVFHRTFPNNADGFLPAISTRLDGQNFKAGEYRISITLRRVKPLESGMPAQPAQLSDAEVAETYMTGNEVIKKNKVVSFKPNMNKLMNTIDFTEQVRLIQKDFAALPGFVKDFFIANDFLTTGWGSNGNSLTPFFNKSSLDKINTTYKSIKDESVSTFEKDIEKYAKKNPNYIKVKRKDKAQETTINARRMAAMAYMAIHGNDYAFDNNGLFKTSTEQIGSNEKNTVVTIEDNHFKSDRLVDKKQYLDKNLTKRPILYYEGFREINMLSAFSDLMTKDKTIQSNNIVYSNGTDDTVQYNQVPVWEFEKGQSYKGIGEKMSPEEYAQRKGYDMATISPDEKERLEKDYMIYEESTKLVSRLHDKLMQEGIDNVEGYRYNTLKGTEKNNQKNSIDAKFKKAQGLFREYNDALTHDKFILSNSLQQNLFKKTQGPIEANIDEYAADPLRRFLEFHFGNHISEYQISEWEFVNGKDFVESITQAEKDKDISDLNMWLSPGDFGKSKPAVAYINKNMKMTHMKYTRNLNLVTKEMNDKLEGLFKLKFGNSIEGKAKKFWMKYSPVGNKSIVDTLFENLVVHTTGLKKVIQKDGSVIYRDMSNTKLNPELFKSDGSIKDGANTVYSRLAKEEQDYLKMYTKFTKFYSGLIENKELYSQSKGATYIPGISSSKWETLQRRGLFGVYFQAFRGDNDLHDLQITAVNPLTGNTETLDYFSWKSIFLYRDKDDNSQIIKEVQGANSSVQTVLNSESNNQSGVERIISFEQVKDRAKQIMKSGTDDANRPVMKSSPINDVMALESEAAMNRFNAKQSMSSSYLATMNLHKALLNYVQIFMFQHGTAYRDGETFKFLKFDIDDREFNETSFNLDDANKKENKLAFTGFEDKKQEIDAAIANLGSGKYYDSNIKIGTGKNKNAINYLQKVVKRHLINKERGFTFSGVEAESGITNFFVNWTMYIALGLNVPAAIGNVMIGKYNAWRQMGIGDMAKGEERFWGVSSEKGYDPDKMKKSRAMIEEFGILTYRAEEIAEGVGGSSLSSLIFAPMIAAEQWIQHAAFLGALTDEQWNAYELNKNGDLVLKKGANPITQQELAILERDVVNVQGRGYSETDSRMIQLYSLSNMTMQFKRWFPTFLRDRFGKEDIDDLGTLRMGSIPAVADFMAKMKDEGKQYDIRQWNEELKKLPKHKRDAVLRWWRGTQGVVIVAMLMGMAGMAMDDDEKKDNPAYEMMEKLLGDMLLIVNAPKLVYMGNIPALNTFKNLNLAVYNAAIGSEYSRKSKYGDKGDKKFVSNLAQLLPSPARIPLKLSEKKKRTL